MCVYTYICIYTCIYIVKFPAYLRWECLSVAESMLTLTFPFCWDHVYIPVLPLQLLEFVNAPTPFIMGVHPGPLQQRNSDGVYIFIYIFIFIYTCKFLDIYVCSNICIYIYIYSSAIATVYVCICMNICICIYMYI